MAVRRTRRAREPRLDAAAALQQGKEAAVSAELPPPQRRARGALVLARYTVLLLVLGVVTLAVYRGRTLALDVDVTHAVQGYGAGWYTWLLMHVSDLGFWPGNVVSYAVIIVALVALRLPREAAVTLVATLTASGATTLLKRVVARPRPTPNLVHVAAHLTDPSFPSGHVVQYTVLYGFVFYVVVMTWRSSLPRNAVLAVCALLIVLVGPSRVFLGEHWASDTLAAYLLAAIWLGLTIELYLRFVARPAAGGAALRADG